VPKDYQKLLASIQGRPDFHLIQTVMLRSLSQAVYSADNNGHFGLNYEAYTHFTSPIRRYPDLLVHRLLKYHLHREGQAAGGGGAHRPLKRDDLQELSRDSSSHERRAIEAEREAVAMYRAYLMRDQIGEEFSGRVSGVQSFGVFVELDEPFVEGMIKLDNLGDGGWDYDETHMRYCTPDELEGLLSEAGLRTVVVGAVDVRATYRDFDDLWQPLTAGIGPSGAYVRSLSEPARDELRRVYRELLGVGDSGFEMVARAWLGTGLVP
jgi:exoribonuclease R